jgi:hypothetical protein
MMLGDGGTLMAVQNRAQGLPLFDFMTCKSRISSNTLIVQTTYREGHWMVPTLLEDHRTAHKVTVASLSRFESEHT